MVLSRSRFTTAFLASFLGTRDEAVRETTISRIVETSISSRRQLRIIKNNYDKKKTELTTIASRPDIVEIPMSGRRSITASLNV